MCKQSDDFTHHTFDQLRGLLEDNRQVNRSDGHTLIECGHVERSIREDVLFSNLNEAA